MAPDVVISNLDYKPLSVGDLFGANNFYFVPKYQRGYSWRTEEVKELLTDIREAQETFPDEIYLLGQIIVCPSETPVSSLTSGVVQQDLIDGQQRCTTLYLITLIAYNLIKASQDNHELSTTDEYIFGQLNILRHLPDSTQNEVFHPRIRVAADGEVIVKALISNSDLPRAVGPTQRNLASAIDEIKDFLESLPLEKLIAFTNFLLSKVAVVRLALNSSAHALRVFQKVNNRGLELDAADLIKNWIFQKVPSHDEFNWLAEKWDTAAKNLDTARLKRVKSMEFLMKILIGIKTGNSIPTGRLYVEWERLLKTADDARELAQSLPDSALALAAISKNNIPVINQSTDLTTGTYLQGWIQQFEILLAGSHLQRESYDRLLMMVEDRAMLSYWAKEPSQDFERIIHPWAKKVNGLDSNPRIEELFEAASSAIENIDELFERAYLGVKKLNYGVLSQRPRIRYVLARVNKAFQSKMHVSQYTLSELMKTQTQENERGYDIDHVFPQSIEQRAHWKVSELRNAELGAADRSEQIINSIGNLVLLHPSDNRSQSDALPSDPQKITNLNQSELYVNRLLVSSDNWISMQSRAVNLMKETISSVPKSVNSFADPDKKYISDWSEEAVEIRAELYWKILSEDIRTNLGLTIS